MRHTLHGLSSLVPVAALSLALSSSCSPADADPAAPSTSEVRAVGDFRAIDLAGVIEVEARIDRATRVEVIGEPDKIKKVKTTVKDGVLVIDTDRSLKRAKHLRVVVTAPSLDGLSISGTGKLSASGLAGRLDASLSGTGAMTLEGKAPSVVFKIDGTGQLNARAMVAAKATISVPGTGTAELHVTKELDVTISGTGAVDVYGNPGSIKKSISGTGAVTVR